MVSLCRPQKDILDTVTTFNIQARYDDYKLSFFNKCTKNFTIKWVENIKEFRSWLKHNHLNQS